MHAMLRNNLVFKMHFLRPSTAIWHCALVFVFLIGQFSLCLKQKQFFGPKSVLMLTPRLLVSSFYGFKILFSAVSMVNSAVVGNEKDSN